MSLETGTAKAAVFFGPGKPFEIRDVPIPEVEPEGVLIRVTLANICGSAPTLCLGLNLRRSPLQSAAAASSSIFLTSPQLLILYC